MAIGTDMLYINKFDDIE